MVLYSHLHSVILDFSISKSHKVRKSDFPPKTSKSISKGAVKGEFKTNSRESPQNVHIQFFMYDNLLCRKNEMNISAIFLEKKQKTH